MLTPASGLAGPPPDVGAGAGVGVPVLVGAGPSDPPCPTLLGVGAGFWDGLAGGAAEHAAIVAKPMALASASAVE